MIAPADIERRALEVRASASGGRLGGYAAVFDSPSLDLGGFTEVIRPGAFGPSLARAGGADVLALYDHDRRSVLGRTSSGTLRLDEDARGLRFSLDVPDTTVGRDLLELVGRGDVTGGSIGFVARRDRWSAGKTPARRELLEVELLEVTITPVPAYAATTVSRRALGMAGLEVRRARLAQMLEVLHGIR